MRMFGLFLLCVWAAYCADSHFYGGLYADTVLTVTRQVARGVLMGLIRYT